MAKGQQTNGRNWYAMIAGGLILAVVGWCVVVVATGSTMVYENKTKIAVQEECISGIKEDVQEIKGDVKTLLRR